MKELINIETIIKDLIDTDIIIKKETTIQDLELESLEIIELVYNVNSKFEIDIDIMLINKDTSIEELIELINKEAND